MASMIENGDCMKGLFSDFHDIEFPRNSDIVYIIYIVKDSEEIPIYAGESCRHMGRLGDYISANFSTPTDFKVGEAIKYIRTFGYNVRIKYKETLDRKNKEREISSYLRERYSLLNDLPGYDYLTAIESDERLKVQEFVREKILAKDSGSNNKQDADEKDFHSPEISVTNRVSKAIPKSGLSEKVIKARVGNIGGKGPERLELQISRKYDQWLPKTTLKQVEIKIDDQLYKAPLSHGKPKGANWYFLVDWICEERIKKQTKVLRMHGFRHGNPLELRAITPGHQFEVVRR